MLNPELIKLTHSQMKEKVDKLLSSIQSESVLFRNDLDEIAFRLKNAKDRPHEYWEAKYLEDFYKIQSIESAMMDYEEDDDEFDRL